jgi:hypothetical protein
MDNVDQLHEEMNESNCHNQQTKIMSVIVILGSIGLFAVLLWLAATDDS